MTKGSDLLVAALENEGVEYIFGVPGEENLDVVEALTQFAPSCSRDTSSRRRSWRRRTGG